MTLSRALRRPRSDAGGKEEGSGRFRGSYGAVGLFCPLGFQCPYPHEGITVCTIRKPSLFLWEGVSYQERDSAVCIFVTSILICTKRILQKKYFNKCVFDPHSCYFLYYAIAKSVKKRTLTPVLLVYSPYFSLFVALNCDLTLLSRHHNT